MLISRLEAKLLVVPEEVQFPVWGPANVIVNNGGSGVKPRLIAGVLASRNDPL